MSLRIGEVVEANTVEFVAQCYELHRAPPLGSLVKTTTPGETYGIVYNAATSSLEPGRRPVARGRGETREEDIYRANPQLAKLFRTDFNAVVVGHREGDLLHHYLPPWIALIHSFVYLCELEEVKEFTQHLDFLSLLLSAPLSIPNEELVAASLRYASQASPDPRKFLVGAGKELASLLGGEPHRLNAILRRIKR